MDGAELVGREAELEAVRAAVGDVAAGASRVLLVSGEPGIGKSALLQAIAEEAAVARMRVLSGRGAEQESEVPFGLVVDLLDDEAAGLDPALVPPGLADVLPGLAAGPPPDVAGPAQRFRYHRALRSLVETLARDEPVALLLDDLHWADESSLEWVLHLLRRPGHRPHLLVLALRPVDPLPRLLDGVRGLPNARHLPLGPLSTGDADRLLPEVPDARRRRITAEAAGNPLFLLELARGASGDGGLPATIAAAVELELATLPDAARALLQGAAVAGDPFDPTLAAAVAGVQDALPPLDALRAADLVRLEPDGRAVRFRHPLVRRAVLDTTPMTVAAGLHERAIVALRARGTGPEGLAHHVERIARPGDAPAVEILLAAASAVAAHAPATTARWLQRATELDPAAPPGLRAGRLAQAARALAAAGQQVQSHAAYLEALALLAPDADVELRVELLAELTELDFRLSSPRDARDRLGAALDALPAATAPHLRARLVFCLACAVAQEQDYAAVAALAGASAPALREHAPALAVSDVALGGLVAAWQGRLDVALEHVDRASDGFAALSLAEVGAHPMSAYVVGQAEFARQQAGVGLRIAERGLEAVRATGNDGAIVLVQAIHAQCAVEVADARVARSSVTALEDVAHLQHASYGIGYALVARMQLARLDGDREDGQAALAAWRAVRDTLAHATLQASGELQAGLLLCDDDPARGAETLLAAFGDPAADQGALRRSAPDVVLALLAAGRADAAAQLVDRFDAGTGPGDPPAHPVLHAAALVARAVLALHGRDAAGAERLARAAAELLEPTDYRALQFDADLALARALARLDRRQEAIERLRRAADRASAVAAWALRDDAATELRRLGSRLPALLRVAGEEGELTERERQIAELVVAGRSNKEVAALLYLSPKTIEHALSRIYAKLGVKSRTQLGPALREPGVR